eukprot:s7223_g3.t1
MACGCHTSLCVEPLRPNFVTILSPPLPSCTPRYRHHGLLFQRERDARRRGRHWQHPCHLHGRHWTGVRAAVHSFQGGHSTLQFHAHQRQRCFWDYRPACKHPRPPCEAVFLSDAVHIAISVCLFFGVAAGRDYESGLLDMAFAPFGALLRWWLSLFNKYTSPFPLFTLVQICTVWCQFTFLVAHGPRIQGSDDQPARAFWAQCAQGLQRRPEGSAIILLVDANSRLGDVATEAVSGYDAEQEGRAGEIFHEFLLAVGCCVPSTFVCFHQGSSWTWTAPAAFGESTRRRIDYIGVPQEWKHFALRSWVWEQMESMQRRDDHRPVCLSARFGKHTAPQFYQKATRRPHRPIRHPTPEQARQFVQSLSQADSIPWLLGPDAHFTALVPDMKAACAGLDPADEVQAVQAHLSLDTLALIRERAQLRAYLRCENVELRRRRLLVAFAAFVVGTQHAVPTVRAGEIAHAWLRQMDVSIAAAVARLNSLVGDLRRALKLDRIAYLHGLVQEVRLQDLRDPRRLFAAVRKAFPKARSARRSGFTPLPAVLCEDGAFAQTPEDKTERWRAHFAGQEAGRVVTSQGYCAAFADPDIPVLPHGAVFDRRCLPTLAEVESQLVALHHNKAAGADGLTAEVYRLSPSGAALSMFPLFLKACLQVREPVEWRGGCLVALAKKAAAALHCDNFRSILMASTMGKVYHRIVRTKLLPSLDAYKGPLQAGTSRGIGVDTVALMVRSFMGLFVQRACTAAVTFYDVKAAYYRLLRHTLVPTLGERPAPSCTHPQAGLGAHATALVADLFRGTWFRLDKSAILNITARGSRPGDPLADVLFGFSLAGYLKAVDQALEARGLATVLPGDLPGADWYDEPLEKCVNHVSWADDYAHLQQASSEPLLRQMVRAAATLHLEMATAIGAELTFAVDKSAVLLPSQCVRWQVPVSSVNPKGLTGYHLHDAVSGREHFLPVVDVYRHLGGIVTANCASTTEVAFRYAQAQSVLRPLRRQLFASADVPLTIRIHLLRSLVLSRFVFASAVTDLTCAVHRRNWCKHYVSLWRALYHRRSKDEHVHSYSVLLRAGATSPLLALAVARAVFLRRLFATGPAQLLHMLHAHWCRKPANAWLAMLELDIKAVAVYSEAARLLLQMPCPVTCLLEQARADAAWWPAQARLAAKGFLRDLQAWSSAPAEQVPKPASTSVCEERPFTCRWCQASFRLHKHVAVHEARAHGSLSPSRHFAPMPYCLACHKWLHSVVRVQYHLRQHPTCLLRRALVFPPLDFIGVRDAEAGDRDMEKARRRGTWQQHVAAQPPLVFQGPRLPSADEALEGLTESEITLRRIQTLYRPSKEVQEWVHGTVSRRSVEGPRLGTVEFWLFPLFTLVANTLGCLCNALGGVYEARASSELGRAALAALSTGFAGSLSTVSTLISELRSDTLGGLRLRISDRRSGLRVILDTECMWLSHELMCRAFVAQLCYHSVPLFLLLPAHRDTGIMGCSSSVSVMHEDVEDAGSTRVIFTDCWQVRLQIGAALAKTHLSNKAAPIGTESSAGRDWTGVRAAVHSVQGLRSGDTDS